MLLGGIRCDVGSWIQGTINLEADDAGVGLLKPFDDNAVVGPDAALDWAAELPLLGKLLGFFGERRGKLIDLRMGKGFWTGERP